MSDLHIDPAELRAKVFEDRITPCDWRVEWFDDDGDCEVEVFTGPDARWRAHWGTLAGVIDQGRISSSEKAGSAGPSTLPDAERALSGKSLRAEFEDFKRRESR